MLLVFGCGCSAAEDTARDKDINAKIPLNDSIDKLASQDEKIIKEGREELKALGDKALDPLRKSATTKNRKLRLQVISIYAEMIFDQKKNPEEDKFIMDSLDDEYYMVRIISSGFLAENGYMDIAKKIIQKRKEPSEDDNKIFNDIIEGMKIRIKDNPQPLIINPTMFEEGYLIGMDKKINKRLEEIIFKENEVVALREKLISVYWHINEKESNNLLIKILEKTKYPEIKEAALSCLRRDINKKNALLIKELRGLLSKEKDLEIKQFYERIIGYLADSGKEK